MTNQEQHRGWISRIRQRAANSAVALAIMLVLAVVATPKAHALPPYCVLHAFTGGADGSTPTGGLLQDGHGNLFGTTASGGTDAQGTVFELTQIHPCKYSYTVLHSFDHSKSEGAVPNGPLVQDAAGNLYGTTLYGGSGFGNVFKLDTKGNLTVLHQFTGLPDGANPLAGLVIDLNGSLYGTTSGGGSLGDPACSNPPGCGVVFEVDKTGKETVLHRFKSGTDGASPEYGALVIDGDYLYGTTQYGGGGKGQSGVGTVFKVHAFLHGEKVLHTFAGTDGILPLGGLVKFLGQFYGTTSQGGSGGWGTVFELSGGKETVLYNFKNGADGGFPQSSLVFSDRLGLLGTTYLGGTSGYGTVFEVHATKEAVLHSFTGGNDGAYPSTGLIKDERRGIYFGTTVSGGDPSCNCGVVFRIKP